MTRKKKTICLSLVAALLVPALALFGRAPSAGAEVMKIATIDTGRVLEAHPAFHEAQAEYQETLAEIQAELEGLDEEEQLMAQQQFQQQMQQLGMQIQQRALNAMKEDVGNFARENDYDYVFDQGVLISGGRDITGEVIEAVGAGEKIPETPAAPQVPVVPQQR